MLNSELNSLQDVLVILNNYNNYTTYIEVSPALYVYLRQQVQSINNFNIDELTKENSNKNFDNINKIFFKRSNSMENLS